MPTQGELAWRARIRIAGSQQVVGAGIVLGTRHLLTCAHVVEKAGGPAGSVDVDLLAWSPALVTTARVPDGCWFPERVDGSADVAMLELASPAPRDARTRLRQRTVSLGLRVQVFGVPAGLEFGQYVTATLAGPTGPSNEWVQVDTVPDQLIVPGFSGGAVLDPVSREILGMLVSRSTGKAPRTAWMIPVETLLRYFPFFDRWTVGTPGVSPSLRQGSPALPHDDHDTRPITQFFTDRGSTGGVHVITTGGPDSPASAAVRWVVTLTDRGQRVASADELSALVKDGAVPPSGSIDLALDVTGLTAEEVAGAILSRLGHPAESSMRAWRDLLADPPPMSLVVMGIDRSADPDRLIDTVLAPLARVARERSVRILLGFVRQSVSGQTLARMPHQLRADRLADKVDRLAGRVAETRRSRQEVAQRVAGTPDLPDRVASLRRDLDAVRAALPAQGLDHLSTMLDDCEAAVGAAAKEVGAVRRRLNRLVDEHRALAHRLDLYLGMAGDRDGGLTSRYHEAKRLLDHRPCDLRAATAAVERYGRAVIQGSGTEDRV